MAVAAAPSIARLMEAAWHLGRERLRRAIDYPLYPLGMLMRTFPVFLLSPLFRDVLKVAHSLWMGFIFKKCCKKDPSFRQIWDQTPKVRATGLSELGGLAGFLKPISAGMKQEIDEGLVPVYKLSWWLDCTEVAPGTFLYYLLATIPRDE